MTAHLYEGCKLCNLINQDAELWFETHRRVLEDRTPRGNVMNWLNARLVERNALLPEEHHIIMFNRQNFQNHFANEPAHVRDMDQVREICKVGFNLQRIREDGAPTKGPTEYRGAPVLDPDVEQHLIVTEADEFVRMKALVAAAERRLHMYNNQLVIREQMAKSDKDTAPVDLQEVALFQKLITELLKLKEKVVKVETSSKVAGAALRQAVELLVDGLMDKVDETATEIHGMLARDMPGSRLPDQVSDLLRAKIGEQLKSSIPNVLATVNKRYGIK